MEKVLVDQLKDHLYFRIQSAEEMQKAARNAGSKPMEEYWGGKLTAYREILSIVDETIRLV